MDILASLSEDPAPDPALAARVSRFLVATEGVDRNEPVRVVLLLQTEADCEKISSIFEVTSRPYRQHVSVVSFTRVHEALIYLGLNITLTTDKHYYNVVNRRVGHVTQPFSGFSEEPDGGQTPDILLVDYVHGRHPDFVRYIPRLVRQSIWSCTKAPLLYIEVEASDKD